MKEFKNFLPQSLSDELHDIMTGDHFPWYWIDDVTTAPEDRTAVPEYYTNQPGMHHTPYIDGKVSEWFGHYNFLYHYIVDALELDQRQWYLARIRCGLNFPTLKSEHMAHNNPHVDYPETERGEHFTCLYYVNESDGPTVVFNEKKESDKYTIAYKCHPEKNKLFAFDGKHYHASSCPREHDVRIAITINLAQRMPNVDSVIRGA